MELLKDQSTESPYTSASWLSGCAPAASPCSLSPPPVLLSGGRAAAVHAEQRECAKAAGMHLERNRPAKSSKGAAEDAAARRAML